jgi:S-DNA-T family DNA segregation ATPase FtsK/SpoIIIE
MRFLGPTSHPRLNEAAAVVFLFAGLFIFAALASYQPFDPSFDTVSSPAHIANLTGRVGALLSDLVLQTFGLAAYAIPILLWLLGWTWIRSVAIESPLIKSIGAAIFVGSTCAGFGLLNWKPIASAIPAGGVAGTVVADYLISTMNIAGALMITAACWIVSLYLISRFEISVLAVWFARPLAWMKSIVVSIAARWSTWRANRVLLAQERAEKRRGIQPAPEFAPERPEPVFEPEPHIDEIPIRTLDLTPSKPAPAPVQPEIRAPEPIPITRRAQPKAPAKPRSDFQLPSTGLLQEPSARSAFDSQELKEIAARIKSKFEEFNVLGSVTQINPGPVVTTFEFKPEAGVKYSRITTLSEDLCLGLQAESILIERIPGKPTVGIEVPNSKREVISLRQILESDEFNASPSPLTIALGKDINGRIKVTALDTMPHLLIAGSTGSGKSVMLNSLIMSILFKATPREVRMIMVDPKRLEFGLYEGIPHLLTPVITDAKKATNALRNAVLEMERRLKLLASQGVRNIDQYNKKVRTLQEKPRNLFEEESAEDELEQIPYVLIIIDELADLMMLERANVEESVTRLAQMARAVGMHLVLATQRPSVDVITGLIKANFPSRMSFRVATRVDSRTVLDVMGAEHLLGKGDMLFLPPGSSRLTRVHGAFVSESETNDVVEFWKEQAEPEYDKTFLIAPPTDDEDNEAEELEGEEDPVYHDAVRIVIEMGKASTSTLQRRLRLGYGRAARILDMMQRDGIIGPPDGSRPREVLKRPEWLEEVVQ